MEGVWRGKGGVKAGDGRGCGIGGGSRKCAILAHQPRLTFNVNQQSLPQ